MQTLGRNSVVHELAEPTVVAGKYLSSHRRVAVVPQPSLSRQRTAAGERALRRRDRRVADRRPHSGSVSYSGVGGIPVTADTLASATPHRSGTGRWSRLAATLTVLSCLVVLAVHVFAPAPVEHIVPVTVSAGDTLWSIAESAQPGGDPRAVIDRIKQINGLNSDTVTAGAVLSVPQSAG